MADIELVIKLSEEEYKHIMGMQFCFPGIRDGKGLLSRILHAIRTSTLLPKGHSDLIDRNDLLQKKYWIDDDGLGYEVNIVNAIDVAMADAIVEADKGG